MAANRPEMARVMTKDSMATQVDTVDEKEKL
jgi:hypothetical protein